MTAFIDGYGREHTDLRVSLTDRCSLRCTYCMPEQGMAWLPNDATLSSDELLRLVSIAVAHGITSVRLTGGEPLLRPDVVELVAAIRALPQAPEVSMTTNAIRLPQLAAPLADAGLKRVNISLDTLNRETFKQLSHRDRLVDTLAGITAAQVAGLYPVKINSVLMRGVNDQQAADLLTWCLAEGLELRFIEQMPLDPQHGWSRTDMVTGPEIREQLTRAGFELTAVADRGSAPAELFYVNGGPATVGIVASVTAPFCGDCNRLRLTADGQWRNCLFAQKEANLRDAMRAGATDQEILAMMTAEVRVKKPGHGLDDPSFMQPDRPMSAIGG